MTTKQWIFAVILVALFSAAGAYVFARRQHVSAPASTAAADRKVLYWYDPMTPGQHFDKPGKSPYMDMQLLPKYADEGDEAEQSSIRIDPGVQQNLGIRVATVEQGALSPAIDAVGTIGLNQRDVAIVQSRANGFVTRVYQLAPGDSIKQGAPLVDFLIPEWAGAQTEFIALLKSGDQRLIDAARQRLWLLGMPNTLVADLEKTQQQQTTVTIHSPTGGFIDSLEVRAGMTISAGATLAKINGLSTVWLEASVPETESASITPGRRVKMELTAFPEKSFSGKVIAILPETNTETRTARVRVELPNPKLELRPGMYARVHFDADETKSALLVPSEAVIRTGTRSLVMVAEDNGHFRPTEVQTGMESRGKTVVLSGLKAGEKIVASGQFLIDSEANLSGVLARLGGEPASRSTTTELYETTGTIESVSADEVVIAHQAVDALHWPAMTMGFKLKDPQQAQTIKPGDRIDFKFSQSDEGYVLEHLHSLGDAP